MMRKAQRKKAKLRLGVSGPAGSGKTFGSLLVAYGITENWDEICLIDTESHSGELYASYSKGGIEIGEYNYIPIESPYTPEKYTAAIKECEASGIKVIIIDSLTHAWSGEGGLLDKKGQIEKKTGNGWTAWRDITPQHNRLVESILNSSCHIIATIRAKMEYVQEKNEQGKSVIKKLGMSPIQRDGMEYEFTVFVDVDQEHQASTTKDRTSLFDGKSFMLVPETGKQLLDWLEQGIEPPHKVDELQRQKIASLAKQAGLNAEQMKQIIRDKPFCAFSSQDLTQDQAQQLIDMLDKMIMEKQEAAQ